MTERGLNVEAATVRSRAVSPARSAAAIEPLDYGPATGADRVRQALNVVGALAQVAMSVYVASAGTDDFARPAAGGDPPLTPAPYAFAIWTPIFAGTIAYAVLQARPRAAARPLFRRMGWGTAVALLATAGWLVVAQGAWAWSTVLMFLVIAGGLAVAMRAIEGELSRVPVPSRADRLLVRAPVSVFLGWTTAAVFANILAVLRGTGVTRPGGETAIAIALLAVATGIASWVTVRTRGNAWYAGAVAWGTIAIAVADFAGLRRTPDPVVGSAALVATAVVLATLVAGWMRRERDPWKPMA